MASRNRMNYASHNNGHYHGYSSFEGVSQQVEALNPSGLGTGGGGRRGPEQSGSRRMPQQASRYAVMDSRVLSNRSAVGMAGPGLMPTPGVESILNNHDQHLGRRSLSYGEGGLLGPGGVHQLSTSSMRGPNNHALYEDYGLHSHDDVQLADGPTRTIYPGPDAVGRGFPDMGVGLGGGLSSELVGKGVIVPGYHGYMSSDEAKFAMTPASQNMQGIGYQGRQLIGEGRLVQSSGYGREDEAAFVPSLSPRAMPMSPRRDDVVRMMSPRRDDLSPPISSRRDVYDDFPYMMSPRRGDLSPMNPRRGDYTDMGLMGRSRLSREEELVQRQDFPMSPRIAAGLTPPMSPRVGWDFEAPPLSPTTLAVPMRSRPHSPPGSPFWRGGAKTPSQWDVLPTKPAVWSRNDREVRVGDSREYGGDISRRAPERPGGGYGAEMDLCRDSYRGLGPTWSLSRKGHGGDVLFVRPEEQDGLLRPPTVSGQGQMGRNFGDQSRGYRAASARPYQYNSVVNQRVGLVTKYIEREREEKRVAKESSDLTNRRYNGQAGKKKAFRTDRREKHVNSVAIGSRNVSKSDKNVGGASDRSLSLVAAIENATKQSNAEKTDDKINGNKLSNGGSSAGGASAVENGNTAQQSTATAAGTSSTPSNTVVETESPKAESGKVAGDTKKKDAGSSGNVRQNTVSSNSANGKSQINFKGGSKPGEAREAPKRPSLVMEIERAKRSRMLGEQQRHLQEMEETYFDTNELSVDFLSKANRSGSRYLRMISDDPYFRRRYQGGQPGLHCLVCGKYEYEPGCEIWVPCKASNTVYSILDVLTLIQRAQIQSKRVDSMAVRKALTEILKLNTMDD